MYESLSGLIPEIDATDEYGEWVFGVMPYVSFGPVMCELYDRIYAFEDAHPEYGLTRYHDILAASGIEWGTESMEAADVSGLDGRTVVALLLAAVRADRFCEGALLEFFESGAIRRWLVRLREIDGDAGNLAIPSYR